MASKKPFAVDGLTVNDILNMGDDLLNALDEREMSRALRTVSLAANKRIDRLLNYSKKRDGKYIEKVNSPGLDLNALNKLEGGRFGVGDKTRNQMLKEFARARRFLNSPSSTIKGAKELRKKKERALFGQTREEITKGMSKKEKKEKIKELQDLMSDVYETYEDFKNEYAMKGGYDKETGRERLQDIGRDMLDGLSPEAAKENAKITDTIQYEEAEAATQADNFWNDINGEPEWWENL